MRLATGFTLGVYREPIKQSFIGVAGAVGLAKPTPMITHSTGAAGRQAIAQRREISGLIRLMKVLARASDK
jgi:hypothetical protein